MSINYKACDSLGFCDTANILINVVENKGPYLKTFNILFEEGEEFKEDVFPLSFSIDEDGINVNSLEIIKKTKNGTNFIDKNTSGVAINLTNVVDYSIRDTLIYTVCDNYCICSTDSVLISFRELENILIYEGISPNNDGLNDQLVIENIENYPFNEIEVYNRWGNLVYRNKEYNNTTNFWDGKSSEGIMLDDEYLPSGIYYYIINLGDGSDVIKGQIVIQY